MIQIIENIIAELQNCPEEYFQAAASITRELTAFVIDDRSYQAVVDHLFNEVHCLRYISLHYMVYITFEWGTCIVNEF